MTNEELQALLVPHKYLWDELSKEDMQQRKQEWVYIQRSLKAMAKIEFRGPYMKAQKALFMKGEFIPTDENDPVSCGTGYGAFAFAYVFFYIWYLPKINETILQEVLVHFMRDEFSRAQKHQQVWFNARHLMFERLYMVGAPKENNEYGLMGDRQKYLAPMLIGEKGQKAVFDHHSEKEDSRCQWFKDPQYLIAQMHFRVVLSGKVLIQFHYRQHIWPQASWYFGQFLENYKVIWKQVNNERQMDYFTVLEWLIDTIEMIVFFDEHPDTAKDADFAIKAKDRIIEQKESGLFAPALSDFMTLVSNRGLGNTQPEDSLKLLE